MNWLINQLFGSQASAHLADKVKALVAQYLLSNPSFTKAGVEAWVTSQADHLISQVLMYFPGWAVAILTQLLNSQINKLTENAFAALAPKSVSAASISA